MKSTDHPVDLSKSAFLITGGAGFIGSNLVSYLLSQGAGKVRVLDNLTTGSFRNISQYVDHPSFEFIDGDIRDHETCRKSCEGIGYVSHQAALGSVPRSIKDPQSTHAINSTGFLNMIIAAKEAGVRRFVYASTSSIYGDSPTLPKREEETGAPLSPYAVSKKTNELYAHVFASIYRMEFIGLRYFNVFGPRQKPDGPYAAVIPLFMKSVMEGRPPSIDGDGEQTRDFSFVDNVVQANVLSMLSSDTEAVNRVFNIAVGERISINQLYKEIARIFGSDVRPIYRQPRAGDVRDSLADISAARKLLSYEPTIKVAEGLALTAQWFRNSKNNI
jgi:UDP-N-acetylglucosamine 4-epimerase